LVPTSAPRRTRRERGAPPRSRGTRRPETEDRQGLTRPRRLRLGRLGGFAGGGLAIGLLAGLHGLVPAVLLLVQVVAAAFGPLLGLLTRLARARYHEIASFLGAAAQGFARFHARLGLVQNAERGPDAQTCQEPQEPAAALVT